MELANNNGGGSEIISAASGAVGVDVAYNEIRYGDPTFENGDEGVSFKDGVRDSRIFGNVTHDPSDKAIHIDSGEREWDPLITNIEIFDNVIYNLPSQGMWVVTEGMGDVDGAHIHHNIIYSVESNGIRLPTPRRRGSRRHRTKHPQRTQHRVERRVVRDQDLPPRRSRDRDPRQHRLEERQVRDLDQRPHHDRPRKPVSGGPILRLHGGSSLQQPADGLRAPKPGSGDRHRHRRNRPRRTPDRLATAAALSRSAFDPGLETVVVTMGENYPDALTAVPYAIRQDAPILLTRLDAVPSETGNEIAQLRPAEIVVLGSPAAVSDGVVAELRNLAPSVNQTCGSDRFATAADIAIEASRRSPPGHVGLHREWRELPGCTRRRADRR